MSEAAIAEAWQMLQRNEPPEAVLAKIRTITPEQPEFRRAQHLRGACALRTDAAAAKRFLIDAIRRGESTSGVWLDLARASARTGMLQDEALDLLQGLPRQISPPRLFDFTVQLMRALGFGDKQPQPYKAVAFEGLLVPILALLLERRQMDEAIDLESLLYEHYVKLTETEAHFAWCMARIAPLFTAAGQRWRAELPPVPAAALKPPYRVGFFIHNASTLAHIEVLLNTLRGYRRLDHQPFEAVVYCLGGRSPEMEAVLARLNVRLVLLDQRYPDAARSAWRRLLHLRELLSEDGVQELAWVSLVTMMPLAFAMRIAPVQTWWAMKYRDFSHREIDGYVTGSALTKYGTAAGRRWRMARLGVDDWYDAAQEEEARRIRSGLGEAVVLMTLARTEKMVDPAYLQAMVEILQAQPHVIFLWAGREENAVVAQAFRAGGVYQQTRFIGWVNTRLYVQVADIFLDTFPAPCGFTLFQAMAAGKPVVVFDSHEAAQTGLLNFIKPLTDGQEGEPQERAELRAIIGDAADPGVSIARSPGDYVRLSQRLIVNVNARRKAGEASQQFMQRYLSDPCVLGRSMAEHLVEIIEERASAAASAG